MALSLVQKENWTNPTETIAEGTKDKDKDKDKGTSNTSSDMVCTKHKGSKLSLLVHLIDGFVIEESNVPFKGSEKEDEVSEAPKVIPTVEDNSEEKVVEDKENEIINASMNSYPEDKDELMSLLPTACKYCGGGLPEDRAMWGKRFCSVSCSKKYSVTYSHRVRRALQRRTTQSTQNIIEKDEKVSGSIRSPVKRRRRTRSREASISRTTQRKIDFSEESPNVTEKKSKEKQPCNIENIDLHFTFPPRAALGFGIDEIDIEDELYGGVEPLLKYAIIPMVKWNTMEVFDYINSIAGCSAYANAFREADIDGQALLLLKIEHMICILNLKLGPALKIASHLRSIKLQYGIHTRSKYLSSPL